ERRLLDFVVSRSVFYSRRRAHKERRAFEFAFGLEPILKFVPGQAATLQINLVSAAPDVVMIGNVVCRNIFCARPTGACVTLQSPISFFFKSHTEPSPLAVDCSSG